MNAPILGSFDLAGLDSGIIERAHEEAKAVNARLEHLFRVEGFDWDSALEMALDLYDGKENES